MDKQSLKSVTKLSSISDAVSILNKKEVIAYPTESVFGIGCDPDSKIAVNRLLTLKQRPIEKGLILIAAHIQQLKPYIDDSTISEKIWKIIFSIWLNSKPITFIFPAKTTTPIWLTGSYHSIAVRITNHPLVVQLCHMFGKPIVSTSANLTENTPCRTLKEVYAQFGNNIPVLNGQVGKYYNPSEIRDALTGKCFREK